MPVYAQKYTVDKQETVEQHEIKGEFVSHKINKDGAIEVTTKVKDENGNEKEETVVIPGNKNRDIVIGDKVYHYDKTTQKVTESNKAEGGKMTSQSTKGVDSNNSATEVSSSGVVVHFKKGNGYYAFDELPSTAGATLKGHYKTLKTANGKTYVMPYKVVSDIPKDDDTIIAEATVTDSEIQPSSDIIFKTKEGEAIEATWKDNTATLKLKSKYGYALKEVYAIVKSKDDKEKQSIAGGFMLQHLNSENLPPVKVVLVKVNGEDVSDGVKKEVQQIYLRAGVRIEFEEETIDVSNLNAVKDGEIEVGDSNILSHYTPEEKEFNAYLKKQPFYKKDRYYLFITNYPASDKAEGFMPLQSQFGFIFSKTAKTIAHELGHGVFGLQHPWDDYSQTKGSTPYLMDYGTGTLLNHMDWKKIHDSKIRLYLFQNDEEGEQNSQQEDPILILLRKLSKETKHSYYAIVHCQDCSSDGAVITLKDGILPIQSIPAESKTFIPEIKAGNSELVGYTSFKNCVAFIYKEKSTKHKVEEEIKTEFTKAYTNEGLWFINLKSRYTLNCSDNAQKASLNLCSVIPKDPNKGIDFSNSNAKTYITNLFSAIKDCLEQKDVIDYDAILSEIRKVLANDFYKEVKACVRLYNSETGYDVTLCNKGINSQNAGITIGIEVRGDGSIRTHINPSENYLQEYVQKLQQEANKRGIKVDVEALRQEVINDLKEAGKTNQTFYQRFIQSVDALLHKKIAGFVEATIASQKIAKNVWKEGAINKSTWHSTGKEAEEHTKWPEYAQFHPLVGGATDGVIDEIVGIPMAIKGVYGIMTDAEQRQAIASMFTKEGISQFWENLKTEAKETLDDKERIEHFGSKSVVQVASTFIPGMQATKLGALGVVAKKTAGVINTVLPDRVIKLLKQLENANRYKPEILKAIKGFLGDIDPKLLEKLADVPGFDKVIEDMAQHWNKFVGGKFQLEYASKLIEKGYKIKFEVNSLSNNLRRVYDITIDKAVKGRLISLELKNWSKIFKSTVKTQFIKDLQKMDKLGDIKWVFKVFNKTKNLNNMEELKKSFIKALKKADGTPIDELDKLFDNKSFRLKVKKWMKTKKNVDGKKFIEWLDKKDGINKIIEIIK